VLRKYALFLLITLFSLPQLFAADQVTLKNGDRLTGKVVKGDGKSIVLHTDAAGDVTIQFSAIQEIKTDQELHVSIKGGKTVIGPVTSTDGKLEVATKTSGTVETAPADVTLIRNDAEQAAYEKSLHPGLEHGWTGGANVGFSIARGNSETENVAIGINAVHASLSDKITLYVNSVDTKNDLATPTTVADLITAGLRYDHNIGSRAFVFGAGDFTSNALQFLDLRQVYSGGFGYHAIKSGRTTLDFLGGLNYTHETYSNGNEVTPPTVPPTFVSYGVTNRFAALTLGENLTQKLGKSTVVTQTWYIYPDLQQTSQYRTTFNLATVTKISKWLGWQNSFDDIFVTNPPVGTKTNDLILTTGLNFSFAH
jgi:putative salt-induced outer membrane protein YdiY